MARTKGEIVENNFIGGLVTEFTPLTTPKNSVIDSLNVRYSKSGRVTRRLGLDYEDGAFDVTVTKSASVAEVLNEFIWKGAGGDGDKDFIVVQYGSLLHFWDASTSTILKGKKKATTIDLATYVADGSTLNPAGFFSDFAYGGGRLLVTNRACDPIYVYYDSVLDVIFAQAIEIKERDLKGLNDGLTLMERVTSTVAAIKTANPAHYYNMLNQGWFVGSYLDDWDTARTDLPSNADFPGLYRDATDDTFNATLVGLKQGSSTPSPKGHFILSSFNADRQTAMEDEGFNGATSTGGTNVISQALGDVLTDFIQLTSDVAVSSGAGTIITATVSTAITGPFTSTATAFDTVTASAFVARFQTSTGQKNISSFLGKDFGLEPKRIQQVVIYPSNINGFSFFVGSVPNTITLELRASNTLPTTGNSGTLLGSFSGGDSTSSKTITSSDTTNSYRYVWVWVRSVLTTTSTSTYHHYLEVAEIVFTERTNIDQPAFDTDTTQTVATSSQKATAAGYLGKDYGAPGFRFQEANIYGSTDAGYGSGVTSVTATLRVSNTAPSNFASDGTSLGSITFTPNTDESPARTITSSDNTSFYRYAWIYFSGNGSLLRVAEVTFTSTTIVVGDPGSLETVTTNERPQAVAFYYSRAIWSGVETSGFNGRIYFSQIVEDDLTYGKCYQVNDPASEFYFDLLPSDGGVIIVPEMGTVQKIFPMQNAFLVFANNGIWAISGSQGQPFTASDYVVRRLSEIGMTSKLSFVEANGVPIWWAEDGISTINYDSRYDSYDVVSLTDDTIKSFILSIPSENRKYVKGTHSPEDNEITWIYNSDEEFNRCCYNSMLVYNTLTKAFSPWSVDDTVVKIRGIFNLFDSQKVDRPVVKYVVTTENSSVQDALGFAEEKSTGYVDWDTSGTSYNFVSSFVTAHMNPTNVLTKFHPTYLFTFFDLMSDSSCFVQAQFDFTTSGNEGKWSTKQQALNTTLTNRTVNFRKLKIRGNGRSMKFKFTSEIGKPFSLIGWSLPITANQEV